MLPNPICEQSPTENFGCWKSPLARSPKWR